MVIWNKDKKAHVFPTDVGVFLNMGGLVLFRTSFPHRRGGYAVVGINA